MDDIDLRGVIATNTDTIDRYAMQIQWKIMNIIHDEELQIGLSSARGWNPFPWLYRADAIRQYNIEAFGDIEDNQDWPPYPSGDSLLYYILSEAVETEIPITLLVTSPLTTLSDLLREHPELDKGINRLIWMGGAINVDGNLDSNTIPAEVANPQAEWNAFWDPYAVDWLFQNTSFPIILFPLDVTDQAPISKELMKNLKDQAPDHRYSDLVYQSYMLTSDEPFFEMWNTLTTSYVAHPEFFDDLETMKLEIVIEGYDQGAIRQSAGGRQVEVVLNIADKDVFYDYVLEQFRRSYAHIETKE
jgi:purine nucleosidase